MPAKRRASPAKSFLTGGLLLALAVLVRPSALALPVLLGLASLFANSRGRGAYQSAPGVRVLGAWPLPAGTTMLLLLAAVLTPWALRNYRVLHHWIWTDTNSGFTLYDGYNPDASGASDQRFWRQMPQLQTMDETARSQYLALRAMEFAREHPGRVMELALAKLARTWSPIPLSDQFGNRRYQFIALAYMLPFDLLVIWGLWRGGLDRSGKVYLVLPAVYLTVVHAMTVGSLRYRLPVEPPLAILAASALAGRSVVSKGTDAMTVGAPG